MTASYVKELATTTCMTTNILPAYKRVKTRSLLAKVERCRWYGGPGHNEVTCAGCVEAIKPIIAKPSPTNDRVA